ncbi:MAG TPA: hypothetical protein VGO11_22565 [Chthoniobacteraceae bacterium]|jgi:hypothetical protein|nr:hypothetical protein [Chthoniobacteraceae bacterium]
MTSYAELDHFIEAWVETTGSTLFTEWAGKPARFFYIPGTPPFECFQISVGPPCEGRVTVLAGSVDTNDESELERTWEGAAGQLDSMLAAAMATIETWKQRQG